MSAEELRQLMAALGCDTQADFAEVLGVRQSYVSMLLSGERVLKPGPLMKLVRTLQAESRRGRKKREGS